jgi:hypothetical protein
VEGLTLRIHKLSALPERAALLNILRLKHGTSKGIEMARYWWRLSPRKALLMSVAYQLKTIKYNERPA